MESSESLSAFPRAATNGSAMREVRSLGRTPEMFNRSLDDPIVKQRTAADARMQDFKRILEGPRYTPPGATRTPSPGPGKLSV
ncbi:MAG: hypothetical protein QM813_16140 [Verrucomicrobiota bacterium]